MKKNSMKEGLRFIVMWVGLLLPVAIGALLYWITKDFFLPLALFFLVINKSLFDIYEAIAERKEQEDQQWKNMLSRRKSL